MISTPNFVAQVYANTDVIMPTVLLSTPIDQTCRCSRHRSSKQQGLSCFVSGHEVFIGQICAYRLHKANPYSYHVNIQDMLLSGLSVGPIQLDKREIFEQCSSSLDLAPVW